MIGELMIIFNRTINNLNLFIIIENQLYCNHQCVFDSLLRTFNRYEAQYFDGYVLEIYETTPINIYIKGGQVASLQCNCNQPDWAFSLICEIEEWYSSILKCTIIHGSCIRMFSAQGITNILLIGQRKSGKTTLTEHLVNNQGYAYLDDDCIYMYSSCYFGFNMPILKREDSELFLPKREAIFTTQDGERKTRFAFAAVNTFGECDNIDYIFFPRFNSECNKDILIPKGELFVKILHNTRSYNDVQSLFADISTLTKSSKEAHTLQYTSSENAYNMIKKIISGN